MREEILQRAEEYLARRRQRMRMLRAFTAMALVVAITTSYVLMLPGLTLQSEAYCGHDEHIHDESCYTLELTCGEDERPATETVVSLLQCSFKPHAHTSACYAPDGSLGCGISTKYWHAHSKECYDASGAMVCQLDNNPKHVHTGDCYEMVPDELTCTTEETAGHEHDQSCYGPDKSNGAICGLEENPGHQHGDACYLTSNILTCMISEIMTDHKHTLEECYRVEKYLLCQIPEGYGAHYHTDDCYPVSTEPTCGLESGAGGHTHGDGCYTMKEELTCDELHKHSSSCYDKDGYVICGKLYKEEHNHTSQCVRNVTAVEEGHTHSDACYRKNYTCKLEEHTHTSECYVTPPTTPDETPAPQETVPVSTTIIPTAEPTEIPVETPVPTEAPAETPVPTEAPTEAPQVTPAPTAVPTTSPVPTELPDDDSELQRPPENDDDWNPDEYYIIDSFVTNTFYCGLSAHTHSDACRNENGALVCGYEMEHVHDATCTVRGNNYQCGNTAHVHDAYCVGENGAYTCGMTAHMHTIDCLYGCGKTQHTHGSSCYDANGKLTCKLEEHTHGMICSLSLGDRETEEDITSGRANFADYISDSKWNAEDGVEIKPGANVVYNPETNSFESTLQISFAIPNYVLKGYSYWNGWYWTRVPGQQDFYYNIPDGVYVSDNMLDKPFPITSPDGATIEGTFYIRQTDNGEYYLEIHFSDEYVRNANAGYSMPGWPVNQTPYSQGSISFGCEFGSETAQDNGSIRIEFTTNDVLVIPPKDIEYPDNETATADIAVQKSGSYIREGNKLYYKVLVHSEKGTPDVVKLKDTLTFNGIQVSSFGTPSVSAYTSTWNGYNWVSDNNSQPVKIVSGGPAEVSATQGSYNQHQGPAGDIKMDMHLPQITDPGDNKRYTYEVTYEINLEDVGLEFNGNGNNTVVASSEKGADNKVEASASANVGIYVDSLAKVGSYNQQTDKIKWTITVNGSYQDIAGAVLTDEMFTSIAEADKDTIVIKDESGNVLSDGNGFQINTANGKISSIEFFGTTMENGKEVNRHKYTIEYYTTPTKSDSEYTELNNVTLEYDDEEFTEQGGAYVKRDLRIYKQNTGATNDGTNRIIDWKSGFTVFDSGLNKDLPIKDTLSGENHFMTADQVKTLYNQIQGQTWFSIGANGQMTLTYKDANGVQQTVSAADVAANPSAYADAKFTAFEYTIYKDKLPADYKGQTIEITYQSTADIAGLNGTATYSNGWGVGEGNTGANHTYTQTEIVKVDKLNYWDNNEEVSFSTKTGVVEWHVNVTQDKNYEKLIITDTLPPETKLTNLKIGQYGSTVISLENPNYDETSSTPINLIVNNYDYHEQGLRVTGTYTPSTGKIELIVTAAPGADDGMLQRACIGAGRTIKLKVFAQLKDEYIPDNEGEKINVGRITNNVHVSTNEGEYGNDEHSYNITTEGSAKVTKTDGNNNGNDTNVNNQTGEVSWRVNVTQNNNYDYLEIVDTLPEGIELVDVKLGRYTETKATYDASTADGNGNCTLTFTMGGNDKGVKYTGTYNVNTRKVTIKVEKSDDGQTSEVFGNGKTFQLLYNCKVNEDLMPDTENGEYVVNLGKKTNHVDVTTNAGSYGSDEQSQTITIEKPKPVTDTVGKNHKWSPSLNLLEYVVDLNPDAADLDPSKNMLTVTDKLTYINNPNGYDRELTLIRSSVKLYYADYDANGNPIKDANGRLIKGQEVPYSDWTMEYSSTVYENDWQQSDCTMVLKVPDERAMVLEYDYRVNMKYVPGGNNEIAINNTVSITGYEEENHGSSWDEKWEDYNAGGVVSTEKSLSILKVDASNHAKVIEGAVFTVYQYNSETDTWETHANYVTDGNGNMMVQWQQADDDVQYKENTAYKIVETQPALGYILDPNIEPIYFYWANANITESSLPNNWVADYNPRELVNSPGATEIENARKTTNVAVAKIWEVPDDSLIPKNLTVHLKRYAVPVDVWEAHPEYNHGLSSTIVSVKGDMKSSNATNFVPSFSVLVYAGSTVSFDLTIRKEWTSEGWGNHEPQFANMPANSVMTRTVEGNFVKYHYEMIVTESVDLDGLFVSNWDSSVWGNDWNYDKPTITNVTVTANAGEVDDSSIAAELDQYRDRNYTNTMTLTEAGNWQGLWENLDLIGTDANGNEVHYKYYVIEDSPSGFATTITGGSTDITGSFEIVNTYDESRTEMTDLKVVKVWLDENGDEIDPLLDAVEVRLYQKDELTGREIVFPYNGFPTTVINAATDWQFNFRDLPYGTWDKDGNVTQLYSYRIEEVTKDPSFTTEIIVINSLGDTVTGDNMNGATVTVINSKRHLVDATVHKVWEDEASKNHNNDKITVQLDRYVLTQDGYILDTTHTPETQELSAANDWSYKWENLLDADDDGNSYQYRVSETHVNGVPVEQVGYIPAYSSTNGAIPHDGAMTITNELPAEKIIRKEWVDIDGNPVDAPAGASVKLELWRTTTAQLVPYAKAYNPEVDPGTAVDELVASFTLGAGSNWRRIFYNLPATSLSGEAYYYYVKEIAIEGYTTEYLGNYSDNEGEIVVRNYRDETEITNIRINKQWTDVDGAAVTPNERTEVYFKLYRNDVDITGTLNSSNGVTLDSTNQYIVVSASANWSLNVINLDPEGTYRIVEYLKENGTFVKMEGNASTPASGPAGTSFNVTNRLVEISVEKIWKDAFGNTLTMDNSKQIKLSLYRRAVDGTEVKLQEIILPIQTTDDSGNTVYEWKKTISELLADDHTGSRYTYYVKEESVPDGFVVSYSNANAKATNGIQPVGSGTLYVTNTQEDVEFSLKKEWKDKLGNEMAAPTGVSIAFQLMRRETGQMVDENGAITIVDEVMETIYLPTVYGEWEASFSRQPKTDLNGKAYQYYIQEGSSNGMTDYVVTYDKTGNLSDGDTVTVTNQLQQKEIKLNIMKRWTSGSTAKDVTINLYRYVLDSNGTKVVDPTFSKALTFTVGDTAPYQTVTNLPDFGSFQKDGQNYEGDYNYYVEEQNISEDYTVTYSNDDGKTTVINPQDAALDKDGNLRVINHERAKLNVKKAWNTDNRKDSIAFDLYRKEIPASAIENGEGENEFVDVTFRIVVMNTYTDGNGQQVQEEALLSSVTKTFRKGAQVLWKPTWSTDWTWHPISNSPPQSVVYYKSESGIKTPIQFDTSADNDTASPYPYTFDAGYMVENGTVTWTTDNWYQNGGADNGRWTHSFVVDGIAEASTYSIRAASRAVGDPPVKIGSFTLNGGAGGMQTATMTIGDKTYTYEIHDGDWNMMFYDLPIWSEDGESAFVYYVEEPTDEYLVSYTNNGGIQSGEITITNSDKETEVAEVTVTKAYAEGSPSTPAVEVELYRSVTDGSKTFIERVGTATLNADNNWTYTWSDLLRGGIITQEGTPITGDYTYFVQEVVPSGFTAVYSTDGGVVGFTDNGEVLQGTVNITNVPKTGLTVKKVWNGVSGDEIEFALKRSEIAVGDESGKETVTIEFKMVIDYTWEDEETGIVYPDRMTLATHTETFVKGATVEWKPIWTNVNDDWHPTSGVITYNGNPIAFKQAVNNVDEYHYTFHIGQVNESGTVIWAMDNWFWDDPDYGFSWTQQFNKNAGSTLDTYKLNASNDWQMTFYDLPAQSTDGLYTYRYEVEELTEGYDVNYSYNTSTNETTGEIEGTITITNSEKQPETTFVKVEKKYVTTESDPPEVTVRLYRRITELQADNEGNQVEVTLEELVPDSERKLNASNDWEYTWSNLLCYGEITKDGKTVSGKYSFRIEEDVPEGYEVSYSREEGKVPNNGTVVITNTEVTEIGVEKVWVNQDASTAPEVEFELIQKATPVDGIVNDPNYPTVKVKLQITNDDPFTAGWFAEFYSTTQVVKRESEITWNLWYQSNWGAPGEGDNNGGYLVAPDGTQYPVSRSGRSYTIKFPASSAGTYYWVTGGWFPDDSFNGASDAHATWNSSTSVAEPSLTAKETSMGKYKLNFQNGWKQLISSLPTKDVDGLYTFSYYVRETTLDGYAVQYANNGGIVDGDITITNIRPLAHINVVKQYADGSSTTPAVDVELVRSVTQNDVTLEEVVGTINLSATNDWRHTWGDLEQSGSITKDGVTVGGEYTYYIREKAPLGFSVTYSPNEDGSAPLNGTVTITNTEQSQLKVEKVWGEGAAEQEIQFKLWRRRTENTNLVACPNCGASVATETSHAAKCGTSGHYTCDDNSHSACPYCGNGYVCEGGHGDGVCNATTVACPGCNQTVDSANAHAAACGTSGHYSCNGDHSQMSCGHYKCAGGDHNWCSYCNNGYVCNGSHGNGVCNGGSGTNVCPVCGKTQGWAGEHQNNLTCGRSDHCWQDGKTHDRADCQQNGHYKCDGLNHTWCNLCSNWSCNGSEHGEGICNAVYCDECGVKVNSADEHKAACGHFTCAAGYNAADHVQCECCSAYICNGSQHGSGVCDVSVTITFEVYTGNKNWSGETLDHSVGPYELAVGKEATWTIQYSADWVPGLDTVTLEAECCSDYTIAAPVGTTYVITFTPTQSGTMRFHVNHNPNNGVSTVTPILNAASYSLRTTPRTVYHYSRASETVDTSGATDMGTYTLNSANDWEYIFYELPQYSSDGKYIYEYFVQEITEGFDVSYTNNGGITEGEITITNTKHEPTTIDVPVTKNWVDENGKAYALPEAATRYFKLFDGTTDVTSIATNLTGATLEGAYIKLETPAGKSSAAFTIAELPITGVYTLKEYMLVDGSYVEVKDYLSMTSADGVITVTNKLTDITVYKIWATTSDGSNSYTRPDVTFELWRTYEGGAEELVDTKVMKSPETSLTWNMLPLTVDGTTLYKYFVKEQLPSGFTAGNDASVDIEQGKSGSITNTPTELKVNKIWKKLADGSTFTKTDAEIAYKLMRQKVTISGETETNVGTAEAYGPIITLNSANNWSNMHTLLPLYWKDTANGTSGEYRYYVVEIDADGNEIPAEYSNTSVNVAAPQTITITNTETEITVKKIWSINGGTLPETLPAITLELRYTYTQGTKAASDPVVETVVLTADTEGVTVTQDAAGNVFWQYTWDELAAHDLIDGEAKARYYYVVETVEPEGFTHTGEDMNNFGITGNTPTSGVIEITNELITYTLPETGGAGTTMYTVCGLLMMLFAAFTLMYSNLGTKQRGEGRVS